MGALPASESSRSPSPELKKRKRKAKEVVEEQSEDEENSSDEKATMTEEQALSHAEKRRLKKKQLKAAEEDSSPAKKRKLKDGTAAPSSSSAIRKNSVWVGNMSFKTTQDELRSFFDGVGNITRINMPTNVPTAPGLKPMNRGYAYVDFDTKEAQIAAIGRSEKPLLGRKLLIKDGNDFAGRPAPTVIETPNGVTVNGKTHSKTAQKILRAQKQPPAPTLFIGNLGFETTEQSIRELLEMHRDVPKKKGKEKDDSDSEAEADKKPKDVWIRKVRMGTFEDSGLCKGFAFVDFTSIDNATSALINPKNHRLNGRTLKVEYAGADAVRRGAPKVKREEGEANDRRPPPTRHPRGERREDTRQDRPPRKFQRREEANTNMDVVEASAPEEGARPEFKRDGGEGAGAPVKHKGPRVRPRPGAALALAKRESAAIVPSKGHKIVF